MDDRIRASDADRERVTGRLREHFAAGRLTRDELDERVAAALNARTHGGLRQLMADLPEPGPAGPAASPVPAPAAPPWMAHRRGRRFPPVLLFLLPAVLFAGGHWLFFGIFPVLLAFWLLARLGGALVTGSHRHRHRA